MGSLYSGENSLVVLSFEQGLKPAEIAEPLRARDSPAGDHSPYNLCRFQRSWLAIKDP
jgi:hypothetical protein